MKTLVWIPGIGVIIGLMLSEHHPEIIDQLLASTVWHAGWITFLLYQVYS